MTADGEFVWTIKDERGMYVVNVDLPEAGTWGAEFTTTATDAAGVETGEQRMTFSVLDAPTAIAVGQKAPASKTPTVADVGGDVSKISTDTKPDPAFYQTSVADALAAHKPFMLVFATPKFCTTAQCGPTLDLFKPVAAANPGRDLHQRRAVQAPGCRRSAPAGARPEQAELAHRHRCHQ